MQRIGNWMLLAGAVAGVAWPVSSANAALNSINIFKNVLYLQTSGSAPTTPDAYFFNAGASSDTANEFDTASVSYPGPDSPQALDPDPMDPTEFGFGSQLDPSLAHFNSTYPFGTYTFNLSNSSTLETATASTTYTRDAYTADIPALTSTSYNALQGANPSLGMTIGFNAFTPSPNATEGFTFFSIFPVDTGSSVYSAGFLDPNSTSAFVPANTLMPNTTYGYELDFSDRFDDPASSTGATQGFDVRTDGTFTTSAVPEPGAASVMVIGALVAGRRRRRIAM